MARVRYVRGGGWLTSPEGKRDLENPVGQVKSDQNVER